MQIERRLQAGHLQIEHFTGTKCPVLDSPSSLSLGSVATLVSPHLCSAAKESGNRVAWLYRMAMSVSRGELRKNPPQSPTFAPSMCTS